VAGEDCCCCPKDDCPKEGCPNEGCPKVEDDGVCCPNDGDCSPNEVCPNELCCCPPNEGWPKDGVVGVPEPIEPLDIVLNNEVWGLVTEAEKGDGLTAVCPVDWPNKLLPPPPKVAWAGLISGVGVGEDNADPIHKQHHILFVKEKSSLSLTFIWCVVVKN